MSLTSLGGWSVDAYLSGLPSVFRVDGLGDTLARLLFLIGRVRGGSVGRILQVMLQQGELADVTLVTSNHCWLAIPILIRTLMDLKFYKKTLGLFIFFQVWAVFVQSPMELLLIMEQKYWSD